MTNDNRPGYTGNIESYLYGKDGSSFKIMNRYTGEIPARVFIRRPFKFLFKILISLSLLNYKTQTLKIFVMWRGLATILSKAAIAFFASLIFELVFSTTST